MQKQKCSLIQQCNAFNQQLKFINVRNQPKEEYIMVVLNNIKFIKQINEERENQKLNDNDGQQKELNSSNNLQRNQSEDANQKYQNSRKMISEQEELKQKELFNQSMQQSYKKLDNFAQEVSRSSLYKPQTIQVKQESNASSFINPSNYKSPNQYQSETNLTNNKDSNYNNESGKGMKRLSSEFQVSQNFNQINQNTIDSNNHTNFELQPQNLNLKFQSMVKTLPQVKQIQAKYPLSQQELIQQNQTEQQQVYQKPTVQNQKKEFVKTQQQQLDELRNNEIYFSNKFNPFQAQNKQKDQNMVPEINIWDQENEIEKKGIRRSQQIISMKNQSETPTNVNINNAQQKIVWSDEEIALLTKAQKNLQLNRNKQKEFFEQVTNNYNKYALSKRLPQRPLEQITQKIVSDSFKIYKNDKIKQEKVYKQLIEKSQSNFV